MIQTVYEDDYILALEKPSGLNSAPLPSGGGENLMAELLAARPELAAVRGRQAAEHGLLHRLDRDTSGLVLVAKTQAAYDCLEAEQKQDSLIKEYEALCSTAPHFLPGAKPERAPLVNNEIVSAFRAYGPKGARVAPLGLDFLEGGAAGQTIYRTRLLSLSPEGPDLFRARLSLTRGFRHQVRAHLAWLGYPIRGDLLYGGGEADPPPRLMLHARAVTLRLPGHEDYLRIESGLRL
jgi:23S rRNA pseudouridine1911/1915/1917 synthase